MKFDNLLHYVQDLAFFDLATIMQLTRAPRRQLLVQLSQWTKRGRLMRLKRGLYALAKPYRTGPLVPARIANELYRPSYLSGAWALSYHGWIPEKVTQWTSVTTRVTRKFRNKLGVFIYQHLKSDFFWGYESQTINDEPVWIAEPEKALLDYLHLHRGEWSRERLKEMRFQDMDEAHTDKLQFYALKWGSPRLKKAIRQLLDLQSEERDGDIIL
jgi:predicted transcriptional regulator of viral defense system